MEAVEVEVSVPAIGVGTQLKQLLRIAAATDTAIPSAFLWSFVPRP